MPAHVRLVLLNAKPVCQKLGASHVLLDTPKNKTQSPKPVAQNVSSVNPHASHAQEHQTSVQAVLMDTSSSGGNAVENSDLLSRSNS